MSGSQTNQSSTGAVQELQRRIHRHLEEAQRNAHNALKVGDATIQELQQQSETLQSTEELLEENEELVKQSLRVLRGMTWSGSLYNVYSDISSIFSGPGHHSEIELHQEKTCEERLPTPLYRSQKLPSQNAQQLWQPTSSSSSSQALEPTTVGSDEDVILTELAGAIDSLKSMGIIMGEQLQQQNSQIDRIDTKADLVHDKTLAVSIKASKLGRSSQPNAGVYIGTYQFLATSNLFMLAAKGDNLVLTTSADLTTLFKCYVRQNTIISLQNEVTGKYVGCTMWGTVAVSGEYFGSHEECYIDLDGKESGLMFVARNWGSGGWLKLGEPIPDDFATPVVEHHIIVSTTTSNMEDRTDMIAFRAIKCK
jgi:hypothetical protein